MDDNARARSVPLGFPTIVGVGGLAGMVGVGGEPWQVAVSGVFAVILLSTDVVRGWPVVVARFGNRNPS